MYASYFYSAGATAADILSDVVAILTGETTVADLSTSCDKTNTTITASARVAGWTVHDASAGTNAQVIKAVIADNDSQYKYLRIDTNTTGYIFVALYETWDETAHTGTNAVNYAATNSYHQQISTTRGGRIEISASVRHACFYAKIPTSEWGAPLSVNYPLMILERTRLSIWDTVANGYLPVISSNTFNSGYETRRRDADGGADVSTTSASVVLFTPFADSLLTTTTCHFTNGTTNYYPLVPFGYNKESDWHLGGWVSKMADIYLTVKYSLGTGDTITLDGNDYIVWGLAAGNNLAVRKG